MNNPVFQQNLDDKRGPQPGGPFLLSQMWDCQEDRDRIFRECRYEDALIQPPREVLDIHMGEYASGGRSAQP